MLLFAFSGGPDKKPVMLGREYFGLFSMSFPLYFLSSNFASVDFCSIKHCFASGSLLNNVAQLFMSMHVLVCKLLTQLDHELHCQLSKHELLPLPPLDPPLLDDV